MTTPALLCDLCGIPAADCGCPQPERCATCDETVGKSGHQQRDRLDGYLLDVWLCLGCCHGSCGERACVEPS